MNEHSDRRSVRVESPLAVTAGQGQQSATSAPESMPAGNVVRASASERQRRVSRDELTVLADRLSDRDRAVLADVRRYGFLTSAQIQALHFHTYNKPTVAARVTRRDLLRLRSQGLIEPLERRIGGLRAGSASYVWRLGLIGDRLLREPDAPRARRKEPSPRFLDHRLAVAEVACRLTEAARNGVFELLQAYPEPDSWRPFATDYGFRDVLKPDLYAVTASDHFEDHWFVEVDRATESLQTVVGQCAQYERYRRSGREQTAVGLFPRVLWLVPDDHRRERLSEAIQRSRDLDSDLFHVARQQDRVETIKQLTKEGGD